MLHNTARKPSSVKQLRFCRDVPIIATTSHCSVGQPYHRLDNAFDRAVVK